MNTSRSQRLWYVIGDIEGAVNREALTNWQVAKESAGKFNPHVKIEAYHENIKDGQFNVAWFKTFTLVFNALDNLDARRHVNKMCLAADVPLIESGTTGFNGQVQVIKKVNISWKSIIGVELLTIVGRLKPSVTIALPKIHPSPSPSARFEVPRHNLYTA